MARNDNVLASIRDGIGVERTPRELATTAIGRRTCRSGVMLGPPIASRRDATGAGRESGPPPAALRCGASSLHNNALSQFSLSMLLTVTALACAQSTSEPCYSMRALSSSTRGITPFNTVNFRISAGRISRIFDYRLNRSVGYRRCPMQWCRLQLQVLRPAAAAVRCMPGAVDHTPR